MSCNELVKNLTKDKYIHETLASGRGASRGRKLVDPVRPPAVSRSVGGVQDLQNHIVGPPEAKKQKFFFLHFASNDDIYWLQYF